MKTLEQLLNQVSKLFRNKDWKKARLSCYDFNLAKYPYGWSFNVVNDWHKWGDKDYKTDFGVYKNPEDAVMAFLIYIQDKKINVRKLMDKD